MGARSSSRVIASDPAACSSSRWGPTRRDSSRISRGGRAARTSIPSGHASRVAEQGYVRADPGHLRRWRMSFRIEESFELRAPVDTAWRYLADPRQVVHCLPGAELTEIKDDATYLGRVKVKVGPVIAAYDGKVTITSRDDAAYLVSMVGEGREKTGSGSAKMTMTSRLTPISATLTQVQVTADVDIVGKAAQFGRGMIESVNKQLFKQFTACVRGTLEAPSPAVTAASSPSPPTEEPPAFPAADRSVIAAPAAAVQPVRILPLLWRTFVDWVRRITSISRA